ncbi:MAG: hypothetical protein ACRD5Z_23215 [Bryobacteraceae bacterium]
MAAKNTNRARNDKLAKRRRVRRAQLRVIKEQTSGQPPKSTPVAAAANKGASTDER